MSIPFAVVGSGRVSSAFARRWSDAGLRFVGVCGRDPERSQRLIEFVGTGRVLESLAELSGATVVLLGVPDGAIADVARDAVAAGGVRPCSLWLHASGSVPLDALQPIDDASARIGALHPACSIPSAEQGVKALDGAAALIEGQESAVQLLQTLASRAGLHPVLGQQIDRAVYHAACAMAANGTTALIASASRAMHDAGVPESGVHALVAGLVQSAIVGSSGGHPALTGPVARADVDTVTSHLRSLTDRPATDALYRALMMAAVPLAREAGADEARLTEIEARLRELNG